MISNEKFWWFLWISSKYDQKCISKMFEMENFQLFQNNFKWNWTLQKVEHQGVSTRYWDPKTIELALSFDFFFFTYAKNFQDSESWPPNLLSGTVNSHSARASKVSDLKFDRFFTNYRSVFFEFKMLILNFWVRTVCRGFSQLVPDLFRIS